MFNNLIESSSHAREFKRRGSFFLFTTGSYVLLFAIAGVASIYAYDARLEDQNTEILTMLSPVDFSAPAPPQVTHSAVGPKRNNNTNQPVSQTKVLMASVAQLDRAPAAVSAKPNGSLPLPNGIVRFTNRDLDPSLPGGLGSSGSGGMGQTGNPNPIVRELDTAPLAAVQKPVPKVITKGVINGVALSLPKPPYPPMARQMQIKGMVSVQVLIDETGKVISAKAISGNPFLVPESLKAAYQARFSPTRIGDQPVKVSGVIIYNFVLQ